MPRGGARPGAGRKRGSKNKRSSVEAAKASAAAAHGDKLPIDIGLAAMRALFEAGDYKAALDGAAKLAPYFHPRFAPDPERRLEPHPEQRRQLSLFEMPAKPAALGKKEAAEQAAHSAAQDEGWGDILSTTH